MQELRELFCITKGYGKGLKIAIQSGGQGQRGYHVDQCAPGAQHGLPACPAPQTLNSCSRVTHMFRQSLFIKIVLPPEAATLLKNVPNRHFTFQSNGRGVTTKTRLFSKHEKKKARSCQRFKFALKRCNIGTLKPAPFTDHLSNTVTPSCITQHQTEQVLTVTHNVPKKTPPSPHLPFPRVR